MDNDIDQHLAQAQGKDLGIPDDISMNDTCSNNREPFHFRWIKSSALSETGRKGFMAGRGARPLKRRVGNLTTGMIFFVIKFLREET
jgi:hypothetical protein